jgi:hypothetical protein
MSDVELEKEFKKFRLEECPPITKEEPVTKVTCTCFTIKPSRLDDLSPQNKLKVIDRRRGSKLIKPARLKLIGNCYAKNNTSTSSENDMSTSKLIEEFTSEQFLKMRISSSPSTCRTLSNVESPLLEDREEKLPSTSSLNCSTQAKLQQQLSEFDSAIDEMSDFLAYHLSLFNRRDKYLIDSMYT